MLHLVDHADKMGYRGEWEWGGLLPLLTQTRLFFLLSDMRYHALVPVSSLRRRGNGAGHLRPPLCHLKWERSDWMLDDASTWP